MPSDLQVSNIKDLTGSNTGLSIASDGQVTISQNNPTITLGSNTTFPDGMIESVETIKYALTTNQNPTVTGTTERIVTRTNGTDQSVESISVIGGYTYLYNFNFDTEIYSNGTQNASVRIASVSLYDDDTDRNAGDTTVSGKLANITLGNNYINASTSASPAYHSVSIWGSVYYSSNDTRYIYLSASTTFAPIIIRFYNSSVTHMYLNIYKIKGNVLDARTS